MLKQYIIRDFAYYADGKLGEFGLHIVTCLTGNSDFETPAVPLNTLKLATTDFQDAAGRTLDGTTADTEQKKELRATLLALLNQQADYVEKQANYNPALMRSTGYNLTVDSKAARLVPGSSAILSAKNEVTTKIRLELKVADNAWSYLIYVRVGTGAWQLWQVFSDPHDVVVAGLVPGTMYDFRVQVLGSKNQLSDFSDSLSHMAT